jgi:hypothetical protein
VLISEGDAFLIMHLWELYPGLGCELSSVVRTLRQQGVTADMLDDGSWPVMGEWGLCPRLVAIVGTEVGFMRRITLEMELEFHQLSHYAAVTTGCDA